MDEKDWDWETDVAFERRINNQEKVVKK